MKAYQLNLILCFVLVGVGLWSYEASGRDFHTLSVPVLGILLSLFHKPLKESNQKMEKAAMLASLIVFIIMLLPLKNSIQGNNMMAVVRVSIVLLACGLALIMYMRILKNRP